MGRGMTIAQWAREFERTGKAPFSFSAGGEGDPPDPSKPRDDKVFTQGELNAIVQREKADADAKARDRLKADPDFIAEITAKVKTDIETAAATDKKRKEGEFESLLGDVLGLKEGTIPEDSVLGMAMKTLHGKASGYATTFKTIVDQRLSELPEEMKALMPEDLPPDKQVEWLEKALKVKGGTTTTTTDKKKTNGHADPPSKGTGEIKVDDVVKEMRETGVYRRL